MEVLYDSIFFYSFRVFRLLSSSLLSHSQHFRPFRNDKKHLKKAEGHIGHKRYEYNNTDKIKIV